MMLDLHFRALDQPGATVLAVGAHADDIEIGAGGTLLKLRRRHPEVRLVWLVLSGAGERAAEARAAGRAFGADVVVVEDLTDRFFPDEWAAVKRRIGAVAGDLERCDLVIGPWRLDRHQDHRVVGELLWQTFRSQPVWAYEIAKYEGDLGHPNLLVDLPEDIVDRKIELLLAHFPSQHARAWFDPATFQALLRLRGVEAASTWAEGFHVEKTVW